MPGSTRNQRPKLLEEVRQVLRLHHYSIHTERSYVEWIVPSGSTRCGRAQISSPPNPRSKRS
jgi:hypothetical protein